MKKLYCLLMIFIPLIAFSQKAVIEFEKLTHDFGNIEEKGGEIVVNFTFKNIGDIPLIITNVRAGCGCTTPDWTRPPVAPNESGVIKVSFDPARRSGKFKKTVTVNSNAENSFITLTISGNIIGRGGEYSNEYSHSLGSLKTNSSNINFGNVYNTEIAEETIGILNTADDAVKLTLIPNHAAIQAVVFPEVLKKGEKGEITITYDASKRNEWGFVSDNLAINTGKGEHLSLPIIANIKEDFSKEELEGYRNAPIASFSELEKDLGTLIKNGNKKHEFFIENTGNSDLIVRKIKTSDNNIEASIARAVIKPGKKSKVTVSMQADDKPGKKLKLVSFILNDPQNSMVSYKLTGHIQ